MLIDPMSVLDPAGPQAGRINTLWWFLLIAAAIVFVTFAAALLLALRRGTRRASDTAPDPSPEPVVERSLARWVGGAVAVTAVILLSFTIASYLTGRGIATIVGPRPLTIKITGHQWWWDVQYEDPLPSRRLRSANEVHIPVGRPVLFRLASADVIHSFWVPNLHGKRDLTPGYVSFTWLQADRPGVFRGQCAEFCGHQHAKMGFVVVAHPPDDFARWYAAQLTPARPPSDSVQLVGHDLVVKGACAMCHALSGTPAGSRVGPDLTHVGSRRTLGAGTLPNTRANLASWIRDPQAIKPGAKMPPQPLSAPELQAVVSYLEQLK